jgi:peroxin-16
MTLQTPLVGLFGALVKDWVPLIDEYYYCKSLPYLNSIFTDRTLDTAP